MNYLDTKMDQSAIEEWRDNLKKYEAEKTGYSLGFVRPPPRITNSDIQKLENHYNPILQTFTNRE